jgi:hypothetical protein
MHLKKYNTIKFATNALILGILLGCSSGQLTFNAGPINKNDISSPTYFSNTFLNSNYSASEKEFIEKIFMLDDVSDEMISGLETILLRANLTNNDRARFATLKTDIFKIKENLDLKIEISAPIELKELYIESIFRLPYNFEITFEEHEDSLEFIQNNKNFCNSFAMDSINAIAKSDLIRHQETFIISDNNQNMNSMYQEIKADLIFLYEGQDPQSFASQILLVDASDERSKKIERLATPARIQFIPRIRQDVNILIFDTDHDIQKKLIPAFKYNFANKLTYISTSKALGSGLNKGELIDYEDIFFSGPNFFIKEPLKLAGENSLIQAIINDILVLETIKNLNLKTSAVNGKTGILLLEGGCTKRFMSVSKLNT